VTDLLYSDTERSLASALRPLLADRAAPSAVVARTERPDSCDLDLWHALAAEIGLAGLLIPEPLGGAGASYRELAAAAEELGAAVAPVPYLGSAAVATTVLLSAARSAARAASSPGPSSPRGSSGVSPAASLLTRLADGSLTAVLAVEFTAAPGTTGRPGTTGSPGNAGPAGSGVRVAGQKPGDAATGVVRLRGMVRSVADALPAGVLLVPAEGVPGALYLVEADAPGVHVAPLVSLDMTRQVADVTFDDAPARQVAVGAGAAAAVEAGLTAGAAILAAEQLGLAQRCLDVTVAYAKERRQFARPIGSFQAVKHRLADLWTAIAQARAASRYAVACLAEADPDTPVAVALAKSACSEVAVLAAEECVQLHGGIGFTWEHPAHLYLKRAKASSLGFGAPGVHRAALASLVNLPAPELAVRGEAVGFSLAVDNPDGSARRNAGVPVVTPDRLVPLRGGAAVSFVEMRPAGHGPRHGRGPRLPCLCVTGRHRHRDQPEGQARHHHRAGHPDGGR
jgi:alkylation response protein AidB-like acyl-CoA dehydrogenase